MSKTFSLVWIFLSLTTILAPAAAQQCLPTIQVAGSAEPGVTAEKGVVVEKVVKELAGEKAGIKQGDILLRWSRGETGGTLDSPHCLTWVEFDQGPRGPVLIEGLRGGEKRVWTVQIKRWGVQARPSLSASVANEYEEMQRPGNAAALLDKGRWKALAGRLDPLSRGWLYMQRGSLLSAQRRWDEAEAAYQEAFKEAGENALGAWRIALVWGNELLSRGEYVRARTQYLAAYSAAQKLQADSLASAIMLKNLALTDFYTGDYKLAEQKLIAAIHLFQTAAPASLPITGMYQMLGRVKEDQAELDESEQYYLHAIEILEELGEGNSLEAAWNLGSVATIYSTRGELEKAEEYLRKSLPIEERFEPASANLAAVIMGLGYVAKERGEFEKAELYDLEALRILKANAPAASQRAALEHLAELNREWGKPGKARQYLEQALAIQQKLGLADSFASYIFRTIGELDSRQGNFAAAEANFKEAYRIDDELAPNILYRAETLSSLGKLACKREQLKDCEQYQAQAAAIQEKTIPGSRYLAETFIRLGEVNRRLGQIEAAMRFYEKAGTTLEKQSGTLGGTREAQASFRAEYKLFYHDYPDLLTRRGEPAKALQVIEQSRARVLLEMLSWARVDLHQGIDPALLEKERALQRTIQEKSELRIRLLSEKHAEERTNAVEREIENLTSSYDDIKDRIRRASPKYAALTQPQPLTATQIQEQLLDKDTLLLEYSLGEERSHVFAVTQDSLRVFELAKGSEVEGEARRVYGLLAARNRNLRGETAAQRDLRWRKAEAEYARASSSLSRMTLGPVAELMKNKRLVIVADGALHYIPFAALPEPEADGKTPVPLAVNHEIVSLPSASVLALLRQQYKDRKPAPRAVAVLADPVFDKDDLRVIGRKLGEMQPKSTRGPAEKSADNDLFSSSLSAGLLTRSAADLGLRRNGRLALTRLRYTRQEADAIRAAAPAGEALEALDFRASRATATSPELANYRIVHFATHGLLNSKHPELSGLVLSLVDQKGRPQDGFLTLQDIYNMNLSADLVVLSACETGLGKEISGEGLIGLTRGFMYAGATRVVASLWKVSDAATAQLMAEFYKGMEKDGLAPAAALRAAQVKMWKQKRWSSAYYWAAFQIQGEWR